jgi:hypothetical protein
MRTSLFVLKSVKSEKVVAHTQHSHLGEPPALDKGEEPEASGDQPGYGCIRLRRRRGTMFKEIALGAIAVAFWVCL